MSGSSFRSVFMVASCAGAALGCYLVSLRVASERAALEEIETEIVMAQRDIRLLQTEIGTRGRLAQLERWNVKVLALSAPSADQFLNGGFELAKMTTPQHKIELDEPTFAPGGTVRCVLPSVTGGHSRSMSGARHRSGKRQHSRLTFAGTTSAMICSRSIDERYLLPAFTWTSRTSAGPIPITSNSPRLALARVHT